jgi:hypothetical protein
VPAVGSADSLTVWEGISARGPSTVVDGPVRSLTGLGWNDRISSLRVDSGRWEVCREIDFRGCRTLTGHEVVNMDATWNDTISSMRPVTTTAETAEQTARRLYRAILGREPDAPGLRNAATYIARGQIAGVVRSMLSSTEYRNLRAQRSTADLLDQMYRALIGRPADAAARRSYIPAIERGEDAQVIADLMSSDEYASATNDTTTPGEELDFVAQGSGLIVWGANGRYESVFGANITLARDHQARIELTGTTTQTLTGTWTREEDDVVSLAIPDVGGRRIDADGTLLLDENGELGWFELIGGTPGTRASAVMTFVAEGYELPRDEMLCHQEARAQLEDDRGAIVPVLFLVPDRERVSSTRDEIHGDALVLADRGRFSYTCEVDTRRGQVLQASIDRR